MKWEGWVEWVVSALVAVVLALVAVQWVTLEGRVAAIEARVRQSEVEDRGMVRELATVSANQGQVLIRLEQIRVELSGVGGAVAAHVGLGR